MRPTSRRPSIRRWSADFEPDPVTLVRSSGRPIKPLPRGRLRRVVAGLVQLFLGDGREVSTCGARARLCNGCRVVAGLNLALR